tara:strand:+ start:340 stop:987 length:648 start_codon:yes stop_codon:yes gene_type:complete
MAWVMVGTAAVSLGVGIWQSAKANNKAKIELEKANELEQDIKDFEASRQPVINKADEIRAMKNSLTNPNANLPVATKAAEMQIQETDKALANTLDTVRQSGMGSGGATALAQAAAASKSKVSANIQQQEAANAKLAAQGEAKLQADKLNIEGKAIAEEIAAYGRQEDRDIVSLNRLQSQMEGADYTAQQLEAQSTDALMAGVGAGGSALQGADFT